MYELMTFIDDDSFHMYTFTHATHKQRRFYGGGWMIPYTRWDLAWIFCDTQRVDAQVFGCISPYPD